MLVVMRIRPEPRRFLLLLFWACLVLCFSSENHGGVESFCPPDHDRAAFRRRSIATTNRRAFTEERVIRESSAPATTSKQQQQQQQQHPSKTTTARLSSISSSSTSSTSSRLFVDPSRRRNTPRWNSRKAAMMSCRPFFLSASVLEEEQILILDDKDMAKKNKEDSSSPVAVLEDNHHFLPAVAEKKKNGSMNPQLHHLFRSGEEDSSSNGSGGLPFFASAKAVTPLLPPLPTIFQQRNGKQQNSTSTSEGSAFLDQTVVAELGSQAGGGDEHRQSTRAPEGKKTTPALLATEDIENRINLQRQQEVSNNGTQEEASSEPSRGFFGRIKDFLLRRGRNNSITDGDDDAVVHSTSSSLSSANSASSDDDDDDGEKQPKRRGGHSRRRARQLDKILRNLETTGRQYTARTLTGLMHALAEEVDDLDIQVDARDGTPLRSKHIEAVHIQFTRLVFKPLRMGGHDSPSYQYPIGTPTSASSSSSATTTAGRKNHDSNSGINIISADDAFDRMDVDKNGFLDRDELIQALTLAASNSNENNAAMSDLSESSRPILENLASDLFELYDINGDGVVDRKEYKNMVQDMAALRRAETMSDIAKERQNDNQHQEENAWWIPAAQFIQNKTGLFVKESSRKEKEDQEPTKAAAAMVTSPSALEDKMKRADVVGASSTSSDDDEIEMLLQSPEIVDSFTKTLGSITFSDIKMDLRRLFFGVVPILKHIIPGGPLILEPFTTTITGSFNREDIMNSRLLDAGLRRLVMRALRRRVGFVRDILEGAVFRGRAWKTFGGEGGPRVEIPELTNVEFDENDKLIITGKARVWSHPNSPMIEQKFKVRTRIGTRKNGQFIRLEEPELALVIECPESWEKGSEAICKALNIEIPPRPQPLYSFFPIYSPFKLQEDDGFDLGEDNKITSLYIKDGALRFEMSAVLRPGRFLGSHYIAFTLPIRTFIVTRDRVTEGIRSARKVKKAARALKQANVRKKKKKQSKNTSAFVEAELQKRNENDDDDNNRKKSDVDDNSKNGKGFFSRFVDGYLQAERDDAKKERLTTAIRDFFGRQKG